MARIHYVVDGQSLLIGCSIRSNYLERLNSFCIVCGIGNTAIHVQPTSRVCKERMSLSFSRREILYKHCDDLEHIAFASIGRPIPPYSCSLLVFFLGVIPVRMEAWLRLTLVATGLGVLIGALSSATEGP
jgi:hypothetical protein